MAFPDLDQYLFRQKVLAISPTYDVFDHDQRPVLHIVRPILYLRTILSSIASFATLAYFAFLAYLAWGRFKPAGIVLIAIGFAASWLIGLLIQPYRHIYIFSDDTREHLLLSIIQERKFIIITAPYTLVDGAGNQLATFRKNYLYNIIRKRWQVFTNDQELMVEAWEDSIPKSLARRLVGPLYGLLRTNFILTHRGVRLGEFNRQFTIFDRYVLDLTADPERTLDRRVAVALGVLLDTGESR